jgi:hypothetical protein
VALGGGKPFFADHTCVNLELLETRTFSNRVVYDHDARALSWVGASHAQLDTPLWRVVSEWLASDWPFGSVDYAPRT